MFYNNFKSNNMVFINTINPSISKGYLEKGLSSRSIRPRVPEFPLSPGVLCSRDHLHGLGDLLDVLDRLQAEGDDLQGGHATLLLLEGASA